MANNKLLVDERQADIGGFMVGRLLPFRKKRQVGPFTFIESCYLSSHILLFLFKFCTTLTQYLPSILSNHQDYDEYSK